jgi:hypothetical protein
MRHGREGHDFSRAANPAKKWNRVPQTLPRAQPKGTAHVSRRIKKENKQGCPTLRGFRRVGTSNPSIFEGINSGEVRWFPTFRKSRKARPPVEGVGPHSW